MVMGSAKKVLLTKPPKVATAHTATNTTKKETPSTTRVPGETGVRGFKLAILDPVRTWLLFQEPRIGQLAQVRHRLDDAGLEQDL